MFRLLFGLFALPLAAQTQWALPDPPAWALVPDAKAQWLLRKPLTVAHPKVSFEWTARYPAKAEPAPKPCAVPLLNMMRFRKPDPPMPKYVPQGPFRMREFPVPAPSCEDKERK